jgi:hypothetical protein
LTVVILEAKNLKKMDVGGLSGRYIDSSSVLCYQRVVNARCRSKHFHFSIILISSFLKNRSSFCFCSIIIIMQIIT